MSPPGSMDRPIISSVQKIVLYETQARMYIVGSNKKETKFRVLKIDRTEPRDLIMHDDKVEYSQAEIKNILKMVESGNQVTKSHTPSLVRTVSAYGIVGFVQFLTGYYIILIKKRRLVAMIGPHRVYKIEDTCMLPIPNDTVRLNHPDESRYERIFQNVDLTSNFYFSYSYDLTHSLQYNMTQMSRRRNVSQTQSMDSVPDGTVRGIKNAPYRKFVWNNYLLQKYEGCVYADWLLYITHGFIGQSSISVYGKPLYLCLIARRSNQFAGTRFLKRGANCEGSVANEVETEQIVIDASITVLQYGKITSFIQQRGSVPLFWSQDISTIVPKPPISLDKINPYCSVSGRHFSEGLSRYGAPIIVLNLVKTRENKRHESLLSVNFKDECTYLNQFLPADFNIRHIGFDMARVNKRKNSNVLVKLEEIAKQCLKEIGLFFYSRKPIQQDFWADPRLMNIKGAKVDSGCRQTGVIRTNCVDCLDRTNTAQFAIGKSILGYQLYILGVIGKPTLQFETDCVRMLEDLYEDHGDTLALQYGGSNLVHRVNTYRKIAPWTSHSRDIMQTLSRYYSGYFSDTEKQQAINLFLGIFRPNFSAANLWDLPTDYYLHNVNLVKKPSYTQWFDPDILKNLPLSHDEEIKDGCKQLSVIDTTPLDERIDSFDEFYHPFNLSVVEELYSYNLVTSTKDFMPKAATDSSPFCLRVRAAHIHVEKVGYIIGLESRRPWIDFRSSKSEVLKQRGHETMNLSPTGSDTSSDSDTSSVTGQSEIAEGSMDSSDSEENHVVCPKSQLRDMPDSKVIYNFEVTGPSRVSELIYERYVEVAHLAHCDFETCDFYTNKHIELSPMSVFKLDSIYGVELPTLSRKTKDIYEAAVKIGQSAICHTRKLDVDLYLKYTSFKYM